MQRAAFVVFVISTFAGLSATDSPMLEFTRLDLNDGRKLKNVVVKSYDATSGRLLIVADGTALTIPIALIPAPFAEKLKAEAASGTSRRRQEPTTDEPKTSVDLDIA